MLKKKQSAEVLLMNPQLLTLVRALVAFEAASRQLHVLAMEDIRDRDSEFVRCFYALQREITWIKSKIEELESDVEKK